jgi:hypothetical protein
VGLEMGPLSFVSTTEELLQRNSSGCGLERGKYGRRDPSRLPRGTLYPQELVRPSPTSSLTQATDFIFIYLIRTIINIIFFIYLFSNFPVFLLPYVASLTRIIT